jgi:hypothetical protein
MMKLDSEIVNKHLPIQITAICTACGALVELEALVPSLTTISGAQRRHPGSGAIAAVSEQTDG